MDKLKGINKTTILKQSGNKFTVELIIGSPSPDTLDEYLSFRLEVDLPDTNPMLLQVQAKCLERAREIISQQTGELQSLAMKVQ